MAYETVCRFAVKYRDESDYAVSYRLLEERGPDGTFRRLEELAHDGLGEPKWDAVELGEIEARTCAMIAAAYRAGRKAS